MTETSLNERITRLLAYMLRHQPDDFDVELDDHGFGDIDEVVRALVERTGEEITADDVADAIDSGGRQRYEIVKGRIRALYGHSIKIDPGESAEPPEELYLGPPRKPKRSMRS
jgi:putative RNA 2'-phosphotransferase